ncbi:gluconate 2-dehydrogenase subunit 3 family protein [Vulgatibacter sp.]|uniref:gluconate 2-dehydrogenase subunit 3 family protein n=1 Tax=Vulgatibacter sp. TaxID=1971226 RepID=UPI00356A5ED1
MPISRRTILRYGLGGALLLAAGGTGLALQGSALRAPGRQLQVLDPRTYSILAAVADRIVPAGNGFPAATALAVPEKIDALLASGDPGVADEVKQVLLLLENALAGLVFDGRTRPFTKLSPPEQDEALRSWQHSGLSIRRTAFAALHGLCAAAYYASPEIHTLVGYPGPPDFGNVVRTVGGR